MESEFKWGFLLKQFDIASKILEENWIVSLREKLKKNCSSFEQEKLANNSTTTSAPKHEPKPCRQTRIIYPINPKNLILGLSLAFLR